MGRFDTSKYPRPDFARKKWASLNGEWEFSFDTESFDRRILVPFVYQSKKSGIGLQEYHEVVWYRREFQVSDEEVRNGRLLLNFGAVDYEAVIFVNGSEAGRHQGGHTSFVVDITDFVQAGLNELKVKVRDGLETDKPRGKQNWLDEPFGCWYTPSTGIWQEVWLEHVPETYIKRVKITPDLDQYQALCEVFVSDLCPCRVSVSAVIDSEMAGTEYELGENSFLCQNGYGKCLIQFPDMDVARDRVVWSLEHPNLIYVQAKLAGNTGAEDEVLTYFGMRSVSFRNNQFLLNGQGCLQRLVLDQGYWPDTLLTPPDTDAILEDIRLVKEMGFNGVRKHQKIEDPRFYYWADRLGLLVWGELPSCYMFNDNTVKNAANEMMDFIARDFNHPSIVTWVPINESWGVRGIRTQRQQQSFSDMMIFLIKSLDPTRSVSGNDGWEQTANTDILALHDYSFMPSTLHKYDDMEYVINTAGEGRVYLADGQAYRGQPVMLTEYGGIAFAESVDGWGYYNKVRDEKEFLERLEPITAYLIKSEQFAGFCYTQLTDVMQEKNGLLYGDRTPKVPVEKLRRVFGKQIYE